MDRRYKIFVSSTFRDMRLERHKVSEAILQMQGFPAGMEIFPAITEEQWTFIQREIDSCDYYILILGGRYGSLTTEGIGYTEKEFDYAVSREMQILRFLLDDIGRLPEERRETEPALIEKLECFRRKVSNKNVGYFASPDDLKAKVLAALMTAFDSYPQRGWVRAQTTAQQVHWPSRPEVRSVLRDLKRTDKIIDDLVYVAMPIPNEAAYGRFSQLQRICKRFRLRAVHQRDIPRLDPNRLDTIHHLIGQAALVIFDLSIPDPDVIYQLGYQRGLSNVPPEAVLLLTDDPSSSALSYVPFALASFSGERELAAIVTEKLRCLREE